MLLLFSKLFDGQQCRLFLSVSMQDPYRPSVLHRSVEDNGRLATQFSHSSSHGNGIYSPDVGGKYPRHACWC